ncbi:hypothetical protein [Breoghania sp.]|uniref:hypothetical protein n=1 Tax=Breoghania sp. TaxID=2065378 RepID=UPI003749EFCA
MLMIILTGAALLREREHGTIEHLLVMHLTAFEIALAKVWANGLVISSRSPARCCSSLKASWMFRLQARAAFCFSRPSVPSSPPRLSATRSGSGAPPDNRRRADARHSRPQGKTNAGNELRTG